MKHSGINYIIDNEITRRYFKSIKYNQVFDLLIQVFNRDCKHNFVTIRNSV